MRAGAPSAKMAADPKTDQRDPTGGGVLETGVSGRRAPGCRPRETGVMHDGGFWRTAHRPHIYMIEVLLGWSVLKSQMKGI